MTTSTPPSLDRFDRLVRWIGDLDHPFYNDERNRYVWYEGSAAAFQLILLGTYAAATIGVLAEGSEAMPWVLLMMAPVTAGSIMLAIYTERHKTPYAPSLWDLRRGRTWVVLAVTGAFVVSVFAVQWNAGRLTAIGMLCGIGFGLAATMLGIRHQNRLVEEAGDEQ